MMNTRRLRHLVLVGITICVALLCLAGVGFVTAEDSKRLAHEQCVQIAFGVEAYSNSARSPSTSEEVREPTTLNDLVHPPGGGPSYLRHGAADLVDPWGKQYEMERKRRSDGTEYILIHTTAPDGTPISQFGIGPKAEPPK